MPDRSTQSERFAPPLTGAHFNVAVWQPRHQRGDDPFRKDVSQWPKRLIFTRGCLQKEKKGFAPENRQSGNASIA